MPAPGTPADLTPAQQKLILGGDAAFEFRADADKIGRNLSGGAAGRICFGAGTGQRLFKRFGAVERPLGQAVKASSGNDGMCKDPCPSQIIVSVRKNYRQYPSLIHPWIPRSTPAYD